MAPYLTNGKFWQFFRPFWVKRNIDIFKNTEILNVVGVEITYCFKNSIFNPTSLNSNKLIIHMVYYFITTIYETFYDKDLWPEVLWINIIEKWDFCHLFEIKEMLHTDRFLAVIILLIDFSPYISQEDHFDLCELTQHIHYFRNNIINIYTLWWGNQEQRIKETKFVARFIPSSLIKLKNIMLSHPESRNGIVT